MEFAQLLGGVPAVRSSVTLVSKTGGIVTHSNSPILADLGVSVGNDRKGGTLISTDLHLSGLYRVNVSV